MGGYYHQDERDAAVGYGTIGIVVIAAIALLVLGLAFVLSDTPALDGSSAGANAATVEEIRAAR